MSVSELQPERKQRNDNKGIGIEREKKSGFKVRLGAKTILIGECDRIYVDDKFCTFFA